MMAVCMATFRYQLRVPIRTSVSTLPSITIRPRSAGHLVGVTFLPNIEATLVRSISVEATYQGPDIEVVTFPERAPDAGAHVGAGRPFGLFAPPYEVAGLLHSILYHLSAHTLQSHISWAVEESLADCVKEFQWILPDGRKVPPISNDYPTFHLADIRGSGERHLDESDWTSMTGINASDFAGAPLWRAILAEAHRARNNDIRNVVVWCATALDVGVQPHVTPHDVKMDLFRGERAGLGIPDLRIENRDLYGTLARLWYTRHAIVHRGRADLYDRNPQHQNASPLRRLDKRDVEEFLVAVPQGVAFIERVRAER